MTTTAESLIGRASNQLRDPSFLRWPLAELCDYYDDAIRAVILMRPDAGAQTAVIDTAEGAHQHLPAGTLRLLEITGIHNGRALAAADSTWLTASYPDWRTIQGTPERYVYNPNLPGEYWLFPAPASPLQLDAVLVCVPEPQRLPHLSGSTPLAISDAWVNPLLDWILYRAFSKDAENGAQLQLAMQHYQAFSQLLSLKTQTDINTDPMRTAT